MTRDSLGKIAFLIKYLSLTKIGTAFEKLKEKKFQASNPENKNSK